MTMSTSDTDRLQDLLDRWEELCEQGQEPSVEELCRDAPHLAEKLRDWTRVLKSGDWLNRSADEVADETLGEAGILTAEEKKNRQVIGEYALLEELGGGGMGRVFKAVHRKMNRIVALKLLPESLVQSPESVERFQREVQALARLSHPNIVAVHDAGAADGTHFYVMDLVDGDDLSRLVKENGPMPVEEALDCILQAARGLEYAHAQGVVHRDIKPSNLILDHDGTLKLLDLGIARFLPLPEQAADQDLTKTGCVLGTVDYMAPEQAMNTRRADHRADIYSLGCTLHYLLTGQPVFGGETVMERIVAHREHPVSSLRKACPAAPPWLDGVFRKMVAKNPEDRYQSVTALLSDLAQRSAPRSWRWLWIVVVAALLVAVGALVAWLATRPHESPSPEAQKKEKPLDLPEANLVAGRRLCFVENKWAEGLPLLAKSSDAQLQKLATADMKENTSPRERQRLGDRWWDFAGNEVGAAWKASQERSAYWYRQANPLSPRRKAEIEKRMKEVEEQPPRLEVLGRQAKVLPDETHGFARSTNLLLEVSKNETTSPGAVYAGLELKGVRYLNVAVNASPKIERLNKNSFAGLMVDYHVASGYDKRVALGIGVFDKDRQDKNPPWGKHEGPDQYVDLGRHDLYELDLRQWAPPDWDGQVWFTAALQQAGLGSSITAQLIPVAKQQEPKPPSQPAKPKEIPPPKEKEKPAKLSEAPKKAKPLDLPPKPTWRTIGDYPLIAGVWSIVGSGGRQVTVVQHGNDFVATTSYKAGDETVSWRAKGKVDKSGHLSMNLVHTQPHPPDKWLPQTRTADLGLHGKSLEGYVAYEGGGHDFAWRLVEPRSAEEKELSR
jgi:serine/threonine protein kinase